MKKSFTILGITAVAAVSAQNLMPNPGFEAWTGTAPDGWYVTGTTIVQGTGANAHSGTFAVGITAAQPRLATEQSVQLHDTRSQTSTKTYVFSGWYLDNTPNAKFKYWNQFRNTADTGANAMQAADFSVDSPEWKFFTAEAMPNAGATVARPGLRVYGESATNNGGVIYVDDVLFLQTNLTMAVTDVKSFDKAVKMNTIVGNELRVMLPERATVNIYSAEGRLVSSNRVSNGEAQSTLLQWRKELISLR